MPHREVVASTADGELSLARFTCPPGDCLWDHTNLVDTRAVVVFPHQAVGIRREGFGQVVADPNRAMLLDPTSRFERHRLDPEGDVSTYLAVAERLLVALAPPVVDGHGRFRTDHLPAPPRALLRLRVLAHRLEEGHTDELTTDELLLAVLLEVVGAPVASPPDTLARTARAHDRLVEEARARVAAGAMRQWRLADLAAELHVSPEHLHRVFRGRTGTSIHEHRDRLRLARALDMVLEGSDDLTAVATAVGYSSHSHFTRRFRRLYGVTPSTVRTLTPAAVAALGESAS